MRVSRLFVESALDTGQTVELDRRAAHYVFQVLRLRSGDSLTLFNGDGRDLAATLVQCDRRGCTARIEALLATAPEDVLQVALGIGISRGERMDFAIQKAVELGVSDITALATQRSVVQLDGDRLRKRLEHWRGIVISACEQSGRARIPAVDFAADLHGWLEEHRDGILLHHQAGDTLPTLQPPGGGISLLIGPEGGLDETERQAAIACGYRAVRMGPRVMRTETAPLAALAAMQALWGDFR
ncbi:MAG: 16S rRNA (uracil(1498)-N(3))-methyltransferase [Gammaproteobacteria bacterium]|nr:16S rRNA (uracil(1498)-N(3))-methyltransferase [Gammaproteobacteria bacterium]